MENAEKLGQQSRKIVAMGFFLILLALASLFALRLWNLNADKQRNVLLADAAEEQHLVYDMARITRSRLEILGAQLSVKNRQEANHKLEVFDALAGSFLVKRKNLTQLLEKPIKVKGAFYDRSDELREWNQLQDLIGQGKAVQDNLYQMILDEKWAGANEKLILANQMQAQVIEGLTRIYTASSIRIKHHTDENSNSISRQTIQASLLGSVAIVLGIGIAIYVWRTIKVTDAMMLKAMNAAIVANRYKSTFLANITHDLKSPLNAIMGYSQLLRMQIGGLGHTELLKDIDKIDDGGRHLLSLINNLLDLAKIESGKMTLYIENLDMPSWLAQVVDIVKPLVAKNGNTLSVKIAENVSEMKADSTKLMEILINLLGNASKFTQHGSIFLEVNREEAEGQAHYQFRVRDTGIGMTPDQMEHIFEAFSQAEASTTRKYGGTGLGLAICKNFTEMMGGTLTVKSQLGKGAEFILMLPVEVGSECKN